MQAELPGCAEYKRKTRYRLIPAMLMATLFGEALGVVIGAATGHIGQGLLTGFIFGLGPQVVRFFPGGHLVKRYIEGRHWTAEEYRTPANLRRIVETVRRRRERLRQLNLTMPAPGCAFATTICSGSTGSTTEASSCSIGNSPEWATFTLISPRWCMRTNRLAPCPPS